MFCSFEFICNVNVCVRQVSEKIQCTSTYEVKVFFSTFQRQQGGERWTNVFVEVQSCQEFCQAVMHPEGLRGRFAVLEMSEIAQAGLSRELFRGI